MGTGDTSLRQKIAQFNSVLPKLPILLGTILCIVALDDDNLALLPQPIDAKIYFVPGF